MDEGPYDPRAVANLILDFADNAALPMRHIALQKLLFFAHATYLVQRGRPLVTGAFEAWQYGPVHPAAYQAFRDAAENPIDFRANAREVLTGAERQLASPTNRDVRLHVMLIVSSYGRLSTGKLIELSHAQDGPWHHVVSGTGSLALGARITDDIIKERFSRPVRSVNSVSSVPEIGEPEREDEPIARNRSR